MFSDPSSLSKHRQKFHQVQAESSLGKSTARRNDRSESHKKNRSAPYSVPVHARVARHVEEHSPQDAKNILNQFATFAIQSTSTSTVTTPSSYDPASDHEFYDTTPSATQGASSSSVSSLSINGPTYILPPCELPGAFHYAQDVRTNCLSVDKNIQCKYQRAYNAEHLQSPQMRSNYPRCSWDVRYSRAGPVRPYGQCEARLGSLTMHRIQCRAHVTSSKARWGASKPTSFSLFYVLKMDIGESSAGLRISVAVLFPACSFSVLKTTQEHTFTLKSLLSNTRLMLCTLFVHRLHPEVHDTYINQLYSSALSGIYTTKRQELIQETTTIQLCVCKI